MIIQGQNEPIIFIFDDINDVPGYDVSVALFNRIEELKHWDLQDLEISEGGLRIDAPITQEESMQWEPGPVHIKMKWLDAVSNETVFLLARDHIVEWEDDMLLDETADTTEEPAESDEGAII